MARTAGDPQGLPARLPIREKMRTGHRPGQQPMRLPDDHVNRKDNAVNREMQSELGYIGGTETNPNQGSRAIIFSC